MAIDIRVYPHLSPRIIEILAPSTSASVQELIDAIRDWEDKSLGMNFPYLIDASGKEDLGGGVSVGVTAELQNAKVLFQQRNTVVEEGTVTTADATGDTLIDSTATFVTNGVAQGDTVWNTTDGSRATVLSVDSETQLTVFPLESGTDNDWDLTDSYKVWQEIEGEINGGNLVAVDGAGSQIPALFSSAGVSYTRTSSSSATLQELDAIQYSSFNGGVTVDVANVTGNASTGIEFPAGTLQEPCTSLEDAASIAATRGFSKIFVIGNLTLSTGDNFQRFEFIGESALKTTITIQAAANVLNCEFYECSVTGVLDGSSQIDRAVLDTLDFVDGFVFNCAIADGTTITLGAGSICNILQCFSGQPGPNTPTIDLNGTGILALRDYNGGIKLTNYTGASAHSIDMASGQVVLDSATVTSGTFVVRGIVKLVDENGTAIAAGTTTWNGGVTVINELTNDKVQEAIDAARLAAALSA